MRMRKGNRLFHETEREHEHPAESHQREEDSPRKGSPNGGSTLLVRVVVTCDHHRFALLLSFLSFASAAPY
jgi:hypothetical protein